MSVLSHWRRLTGGGSLDGQNPVLVASWLAIPCFGAFAIGLEHGQALLTAVGGIGVAAFLLAASYAGLRGVYTEVWPQIKRDVRQVVVRR